MTDQQSIDDIAMLLMRYPGVSSAHGFSSRSDGKVSIHFRFRCGEIASLKAISSCAVGANVVITVGDPDSRLCCEAENVTDLPLDLRIGDDNQLEAPPTDSQIFGVFLVWNLMKSRLLADETADQLLQGWNARPR